MSDSTITVSGRNNKQYRNFTRLFLSLLIIITSVIMIIPFIWMLSASFKMQKDVMTIPIQWIPKYLYLDNYKKVLHVGGVTSKDYHFFLAYYNSLKLGIFNTCFALLSSAMAGYAFAKLKFKGSRVLFIIYLTQLMVPSQLTLIPRFVLFTAFDLTRTHWPLILPKIIAVSAIFMLRQAFISVPNEMRESAMIDGAGEYTIWARIAMPMVTPTLGALATVQFLDSWNSYLDPLIFLSHWRLHTLPIALNQFVGETYTQYNLVMAACCLTVIPVFIVFLGGQKFFIKGLTIGSVKG
ncbi:MAG: carbohydrate ABC transporter permease [Treponema sp.]|nr:carbohydrate ABC transporter permease [Treponema sp.]